MIKELLKEKGLSQKELAEKLNVTQETISRQISGNPTLKTLINIANALDVEVRDLFISAKSGEKLNGFVEYKDTVYKIYSKADLENLLSLIENEETT